MDAVVRLDVLSPSKASFIICKNALISKSFMCILALLIIRLKNLILVSYRMFFPRFCRQELLSSCALMAWRRSDVERRT